MTSQKPRLRLLQSILHLALLGTLGSTVLGLTVGLIGTGLGLLFAFGVGVVLLVGAVYVLYGLGWFETARVSGLYDLDVLPPRLQRGEQSGFVGWLRSLWRQLGDGAMWRALASFALSCLLGMLLMPIVRIIATSIGLLFAPLSERSEHWWLGIEVPAGMAPLFGIGGIVLSLAAVVALALLHRTLSVAIIASAPTEERLTAEAQQSADRARQSAEQREGAVRAADVERTRIERDLHDGVQPRLVSIGMTLGLAQQRIDDDPAATKALIAEAHTSTKAAITELRQLARGIHASVLEDRGLDAALSALAGRSPIPVQLDVRLPAPGGLGTHDADRDAETAVYFCIAESLTNAAKHSRASSCRVTVRRRDTDLTAEVRDDGIGGARVVPGGGLDGLANRVRAAGGTIRIDSPQGGPTTVEVSVPCAS
ncbi:sensor histidine kinase [Leucobacter sp. GX24907]